MIKTAQLYENKLKQKFLETWYDDRYMFYHDGTGSETSEFPDNNYEKHCFASVDKNNDVIGYVGYWVNWTIKSANNFNIISFDIGNMEFIRDVYKVINDIFYKYNFNRIEFFCVSGNPVMKSYHNFVKRHGGRISGYSRQNCITHDGKIRDSVMFEILKKEYKP